ncbi:ATP phosphoribosyltransferase regulatory subunit [Prochlorococcus marinus str. MIT 1318]|uniref:ATP phosphoribosyltransferase regulatory subunit n=1 Tax=Prochlorococcus TaxID=1218 RepID=UPI0007B36F38|nr:ATP phosphoribosyltransferase regulatory subunit [Prochlorococcus marinus]KZR71723.1 ATP phosphoribosyltransferase regulatory subunit [Prochlorococcus marinus str. MIT 1318]
MALQPAAGARDLNPQQVELNQKLSQRLAEVYRLWGYDEVSPPRVERLETLKAGGAIASQDIVRLVADEPLGLRPEMTASIARAACTRLKQRPRPLRLWAAGTIFESRTADEGSLCIEENLQSGVELFGVEPINAEMELLSLLFSAVETLKLSKRHQPRLLVGHTALMDLIMLPFQNDLREKIRTALIHYDRLALENLQLPNDQFERLLHHLECRGEPLDVLERLSGLFGTQQALNNLQRLFEQMGPLAADQGIDLQLDPTFQPHFELYTGLVFQLVCQSDAAPVVIARGGRYDNLVARCGAKGLQAAGVGFSFAIDDIRELLTKEIKASDAVESTLVAYGEQATLEHALKRQHHWHKQGQRAVVELEACRDREDAFSRLSDRGCSTLDWLDH